MQTLQWGPALLLTTIAHTNTQVCHTTHAQSNALQFVTWLYEHLEDLRQSFSTAARTLLFLLSSHPSRYESQLMALTTYVRPLAGGHRRDDLPTACTQSRRSFTCQPCCYKATANLASTTADHGSTSAQHLTP